MHQWRGACDGVGVGACAVETVAYAAGVGGFVCLVDRRVRRERAPELWGHLCLRGGHVRRSGLLRHGGASALGGRLRRVRWGGRMRRGVGSACAVGYAKINRCL